MLELNFETMLSLWTVQLLRDLVSLLMYLYFVLKILSAKFKRSITIVGTSHIDGKISPKRNTDDRQTKN